MKPESLDRSIEPSRLTEEERSELVTASNWAVEFITNEDAVNRLVLSRPNFFSVFVGLVPFSRIPDGQAISSFIGLLRNGSLPEQFSLLLEVTNYERHMGPWRSPLLGIVNIERAKFVFGKTKLGNEEFLDWLIELFKDADWRKKEYLNGILEGFPASASTAFANASLLKNSPRWEVERLTRDNQHEISGNVNSRREVISQEKWFFPASPITYDRGEREFSNFVSFHLPGYFFALPLGSENDVELRSILSRFRFVYVSLGVLEKLKHIHLSAASELGLNSREE